MCFHIMPYKIDHTPYSEMGYAHARIIIIQSLDDWISRPVILSSMAREMEGMTDITVYAVSEVNYETTRRDSPRRALTLSQF